MIFFFLKKKDVSNAKIKNIENKIAAITEWLKIPRKYLKSETYY